MGWAQKRSRKEPTRRTSCDVENGDGQKMECVQ